MVMQTKQSLYILLSVDAGRLQSFFQAQQISERESQCEIKLNILIWYYCAEGKLSGMSKYLNA